MENCEYITIHATGSTLLHRIPDMRAEKVHILDYQLLIFVTRGECNLKYSQCIRRGGNSGSDIQRAGGDKKCPAFRLGAMFG
jgi:hypothetical protein